MSKQTDDKNLIDETTDVTDTLEDQVMDQDTDTTKTNVDMLETTDNSNNDVNVDDTDDNSNQEDAKSDSVDEKNEQKELDQQDEEPQASDLTAEQGLIIINDKKDIRAKWYVVHTYSGHESKVAILIKQRVEALGETNRFFKVLVPQQQKIVVSEGKKRKVDERIFPGYVLVQMIMSDDTWHIVRSTSGVTGFVGTGNNPTPLPKSEVDALFKFMSSEEPKFVSRFTVGDSVKITEGPFAETLGKVEEVNEDQGKLKVLISIFGGETPLELDFTQVKAL